MRRRTVPSLLGNDRGHTLAEMSCAVVMSGFCMGAIGSMMKLQQEAFNTQDQIVVMEQTARTTMQMISRDMRMAGYNPARIAGLTGITYNPGQLRIQADLSGDGTVAQANEDITYVLNGATAQLVRTAPGSTLVIRDIQAVSYAYLDANGTPTAISSNIRQVLVTITARTSSPDPTYQANGGYRTFTLQSRLTPVNLGVSS
jgi:type IV pilus assembly protein PilW